MLSKKKILLILGLSTVAVLLYLLFFSSSGRKKAPETTPTSTAFPTPNPTYFSASKHQALIYDDPQGNFQILEIPSIHAYQIAVFGSPFSKYRLEAEQAFLSLLRISQDEACKLKVAIGTPAFANPDESGIIYPLSFCSQP